MSPVHAADVDTFPLGEPNGSWRTPVDCQLKKAQEEETEFVFLA